MNAHSGCDSWSVAEAREYLRGALVVEHEVGIDICHETHRKRIFWNPFNFREIIKGDETLSKLKVNLDISHWVVCLERCFATEASERENGAVDMWWPEVLDLLKHHVFMMHTRVGYGEGPQVPDPAAPEYKNEVAAHMGWWSEIMKAQIKQGKVCFCEPEHGPWPYQQSVPHTGMKPTHDIWEANNHVANLIREEWPNICKA